MTVQEAQARIKQTIPKLYGGVLFEHLTNINQDTGIIATDNAEATKYLIKQYLDLPIDIALHFALVGLLSKAQKGLSSINVPRAQKAIEDVKALCDFAEKYNKGIDSGCYQFPTQYICLSKEELKAFKKPAKAVIGKFEKAYEKEIKAYKSEQKTLNEVTTKGHR